VTSTIAKPAPSNTKKTNVPNNRPIPKTNKWKKKLGYEDPYA
jgi:hypothetical protein